MYLPSKYNMKLCFGGIFDAKEILNGRDKWGL
jgi:hypothetical protein